MLSNELRKLAKSDQYPFHMPGHKRNLSTGVLGLAYQMDITEIDHFDNLHQPEGILLEIMKLAASMYQSKESYLLVNGSTGGVLAALSASVPKNGKILMARNSHQSAYHAAAIRGLDIVYLNPSYQEEWEIQGAILPEEIERRLQSDPKIQAVFLTSPTYDGIFSNISSIVQICHRFHIPCIVDEAHGAHLGLFEKKDYSAVASGADLVIQSLHKTLPAPTQTALLHWNSKLVEQYRIERYLKIYQTSSPSYLLLAGIEECLTYIRKNGMVLHSEFMELRKDFLDQAAGLKNIRIFSEDETKLIISVKGTTMTGIELYHKLRLKYNLQMEMYSKSYVLAIITMMDTKEGFIRLINALREIDSEIRKKKNENNVYFYQIQPKIDRKIAEALDCEEEAVDLLNAEGRIACSYLQLYPPGVPIVVPGELYTKEILDAIKEYTLLGFKIQGFTSNEEKLLVVKA